MTMKPVRLTFYREIVNDHGRPFHSPLYSVVIRRARTRERAVAAAKLRFQRAHRLRSWRTRASGFVAMELDDPLSFAVEN